MPVRRTFRAAVLSSLCAAVAACGSLPASGPSTGDVVDHSAEKAPENTLGVRLLPLTPAVVRVMNAMPLSSLHGMDKLHANRPMDRIGPGDVLSVAIYETGPGLFGQAKSVATPTGGGTGGDALPAAQTGGGGSSSEVLPRLLVDRQGRITVPYAGQLKVEGLTPTEAQNAIQRRLAGTATQAQVIVGVVSNDTNVVFISGDVKSSGRYPMSLAPESVLDMISLAGGPTHPAQDNVVRLTRRGKTARTWLSEIQDKQDENVQVDPQDRIQVDYQPRTFLSFGATGKVAQIPFDQARVSLAEAVARSGGLDDQRANPESVFLFRFEPADMARAMGLQVVPGQAQVPMIYRVNMREPQNFFLLQAVAMRDKDLVYVANARTVQIYKFLQLINSVVTPLVYSSAISSYR